MFVLELKEKNVTIPSRFDVRAKLKKR